MPRILIVEGDAALASSHAGMLERAGYATRIARSGVAGVAMLSAYEPDVVLLDIGLPASGLDVCTTIAGRADAYILVMSGDATQEQKLLSFGLGADDFIAKPFSERELVARVGAFLRRRERTVAREHEGRLSVGDAVLMRRNSTLERCGRSTTLTTLEFRLLWYLSEADGALLTRAQMLERVWSDVSGLPTRVVDVHVAALRKKLEEIGGGTRIESVRGIGYRLLRAVAAAPVE